MAKVFIMPTPARRTPLSDLRMPDPRYVEGQRLLVRAMTYLVKSGPETNRAAVELISDLVRTRFRASDRLPGFTE